MFVRFVFIAMFVIFMALVGISLLAFAFSSIPLLFIIAIVSIVMSIVTTIQRMNNPKKK